MLKKLSVKFLVLVVLSALAAGVAACGSSGTDTAALKQEGREEQQEKEKGQRLEQKIAKIERERRQEKKRKLKQERKQFQEGPDSSSSAPAPAPAPSSEPASQGTSCGSGVTAGPETTCGFALNVRAEYYAVVGSGSGEFEAYSPTLNEWFPMYCTGAPHECSGAITATVYFP